MTTARRAGTASVAALSGLALTLGFAHTVAPSWVEAAGLDLWNLPGLHRDAREIAAEGVAIQHNLDCLNHEVQLSEHVAGRLAAGTLTLEDAVEELAPILESRPGFAYSAALRFRTPSFRHTAAAYAIDRVNRLLEDDPDRLAVVADRLCAEYGRLK